MRFTVPIFDKIKIFANSKENFEKIGALALNEVYCPDFLTKFGILQTLRKILKKCGPHFE
jgi:hypothetical protein